MRGSDRNRGRKLNDLRAQLDRLGYGKDGTSASRVFSADELRHALDRKPEQVTKRPSASRPPPASSRGDGISLAPGTSPDTRGSDLVAQRTACGSVSSAAPVPPKPEPALSAPAVPDIVYSRRLPRRARATPSVSASELSVVRLEEATDGTEVAVPGVGRMYLVNTDVACVPGAAALSTTFAEHLCLDDSGMCRRILASFGPSRFRPEDVVFMDIETTGLSSSPLFLIGIMLWHGSGFEVRQFLARDYAEEAAVVGMFVDACVDKRLLVTFNGKSFDFPFIRARAAANGITFRLDPVHLDLLHESRRIWRGSLPDCKLQTLERHVCQRNRHGDIPGAEIPDAYHAYVRTANAAQIVEVLKHNMLDLVTLADLMTRFPAAT